MVYHKKGKNLMSRRNIHGIDINLPNSGDLLNTLLTGGTSAAEQLLASSVVNSPGVQDAAKTYAENTIAQKLAKYIVENKKTLTIVGIGAGILLAGYFFSKRK